MPVAGTSNEKLDLAFFGIWYEDRLILFSSKKNRYYFVAGNSFLKLKESIPKYCDESTLSKHVLKQLHKTGDKRFCNVSRLKLSIIEEKIAKNCNLTSFEERFEQYCSSLSLNQDSDYSVRLVVKAVAAIVYSNVLIATEHFDAIATSSKSSSELYNCDSIQKTINSITRHIMLARRIVPLRFDCVNLAFCYKYLLSGFGLSSDIYVGIHKEPFRAHMWATLNGMPLGEVTEVLSDFDLIYNSNWSAQ